MTRVQNHIHDNYENDLTVETLARLIGKSPNHFSHRFKLEFGMSFTSYLTQLRIAHAKQRILTTDELIYEISEKVGFHDLSYFTSVFKKIEGHPPTYFRSRHNEQGRTGRDTAD
jgi:two-component system response regulator YesN